MLESSRVEASIKASSSIREDIRIPYSYWYLLVVVSLKNVLALGLSKIPSPGDLIPCVAAVYYLKYRAYGTQAAF